MADLTHLTAHRISAPVLTTQRSRARACIAAWAVCASACGSSTPWSGDLGRADFAAFQSEVYPVLMRDCGFSNCHGVEERAFQVWGPGRSRLKTKDANILEQERARTYARALSMLYSDGSRPVSESPLLTKPLEISAGGATHAGVDHYGRNVYRSQADAGFQVLARWAAAQAAGTGAAGSPGGL